MKPSEEITRCRYAEQITDTIANNIRNVVCDPKEKQKALMNLMKANKLIKEVETFLKAI